MTPDKEIKKKIGKEKYTVRSIQADLFCGKTKSFKILKLIRTKYPESVKKERIGRSTVTTIEKTTYYEFINDYQLNEKRKIIEKESLKIQNMSRKQLENFCLELCINIENPILIDNKLLYAVEPKTTKTIKTYKKTITYSPTHPGSPTPIKLKSNPEINSLKKIIEKYTK